LTQVVRVGDERDVTYDVCGAPAGVPIFLLHGTPGSHCGPRPRASILYRLGVRLISYDRPGYGASTRCPKRIVASAAQDVRAIADDLDLDDFCVVGRSGGGPHALACAALLGDRVRRAAALVGLAPSDARDFGWYDGMASSNVEEYQAAASGQAEALSSLEARAQRTRANPESLLETLGPDLTDTDRRVVDDIAIRRQLTEAYEEALRYGVDGWIDDVLALRKPWGFDLAAIKQPVLLWHGAQDAFSPVGHAYWLAEQITSSVIEVASQTAHFGAVEILPKALAWLKGGDLRRAADPECASAGAQR
jgi:pimeloyl-ACP methyl ester carboxylesterase